MAGICDDWQLPFLDTKQPNEDADPTTCFAACATKLSHESVRADKIQRQMNADALQGVFDLILAPLQEIANDGAVMDCADGKTRLCFPILSAWIADYAEHTILNGISSKSCLQCEVPATELDQDPRNIYQPRNYAHYAQKT